MTDQMPGNVPQRHGPEGNSDRLAYDLFISHSSDEREVARTIAGLARDRGLRVWFDEWNLTPGCRWAEEIQSAVQSSRYCLILLGNGVNARERSNSQEWSEILKESWLRPDFKPIPVCMANDVEIPAFLTQYSCYSHDHTRSRSQNQPSRESLEQLVNSLVLMLQTGREPDLPLWLRPTRYAHDLHERFQLMKEWLKEQAPESDHE